MNCTARRKDNTPCPRKAGPSGFCRLHDPEQQREIAARGGAAKAAAARDARSELEGIAFESAADVRLLLRRAVELAERSKDGSCAKANVLLRTAAVAMDLLKTVDLQRQFDELQAFVEAQVGKGKAPP